MEVFGSTSRASFMVKLEELLGDMHADLELLNSIEKMSYVLRVNFWERNKSLVKEYIVNVCELRKQKLYGNDSCLIINSVSVLSWGSGGEC